MMLNFLEIWVVKQNLGKVVWWIQLVADLHLKIDDQENI